MPPTDLSPKTRFAWPVVATLLGVAAGAGLAWGVQSANAASMERRVANVEQRQDSHGEQIHSLDKRTALLERAVISLERMAAEAKR